MGIKKYLHYGYVDETGKVIFGELYFDGLNFQITEKTPKVIIETNNQRKTYTFQLTREMYEKINEGQQPREKTVETQTMSKQEVVTEKQEFELVNCYIELRNDTNAFGGIMRTYKYFHYGYIDETGKVIFGELYFDGLNFQITEETPKVIIETNNKGKTYTFQLTKEMYEKINESQQ